MKSVSSPLAYELPDSDTSLLGVKRFVAEGCPDRVTRHFRPEHHGVRRRPRHFFPQHHDAGHRHPQGRVRPCRGRPSRQRVDH